MKIVLCLIGLFFIGIIVLFILAAKKMFKKQEIAQVGMRVHVFGPDKTEDLGFGTITKVDASDNYPSEIKLDNGKITEGVECWWFPLEEL